MNDSAALGRGVGDIGSGDRMHSVPTLSAIHVDLAAWRLIFIAIEFSHQTSSVVLDISSYLLQLSRRQPRGLGPVKSKIRDDETCPLFAPFRFANHGP